MRDDSSLTRRGGWLPGAVGIAGVLIALAGWWLVVAERRDRILDATRETGAEIREAVELGLSQQVEGLQALADLWSDFGRRAPKEWKAHADQLVDQVAGLTSVAWVAFDNPRTRIAAGKTPATDEIEHDAAEARLHPDAASMDGPARDASGAFVYRVFLPVGAPGDRAGALVGRFDVDPFLEAILRTRARGYALRIFWGDEEIFSRGSPTADPGQRWWRDEETIRLPLGGTWRVLQRPTPQFAATRLTPVPDYLLAAGIVLAIVLAFAVHQLRVIARQSRFLALSNRALEERGVELESKVAERTEALEEAVAELEAFNYSVSHDLRSPLGAILNFTAILEEDFRDRSLDAEGAAILARIRSCAARATALLEDLLQLSRAGRAALSIEPLDMTALASEAFAQARAAESDADVEFHVDPLPEAMGDRALLGGVFANLFSNALKYSRGCEKRRIDVSGRIDGDECIYEVADNGNGFDMRFAHKLFGLFERLHAADEIEGTGLGLAMVARVVKRHGGRVWAEGSPGEGARFSFAIPRREMG